MTRFAIIAVVSAVSAMAAQAYETETFSKIDLNENGLISESEFLNWKMSSGDSAMSDALAKFAEIDTDRSDSISEAELQAAMATKDKADSNKAPMIPDETDN